MEKMDIQAERKEAEEARKEAEMAQKDLATARKEAEIAQKDLEMARKEVEEIHKEIGKELFNSNLDYVVTIGEYTKYTDCYLKEHGFDNVMHFDKESDSYVFLDKY